MPYIIHRAKEKLSNIKRLSAVMLLCAAIAFVILTGCAPSDTENTAPNGSGAEERPIVETEPKPRPEPQPEPEPEPVIYTISFAGDCTLGTDHSTYNSEYSFIRTVGDNYAYPLQYASEYFKNDEFTLVNLESVMTEYNVPAEKTYRFRGPPAYVNILTLGGVEAVNLANNHTYDYGKTGYADTKTALEGAGVAYVENEGTTVFETENGLKIGLYAMQFSSNVSAAEKAIAELRAAGAEIVIVSAHWGIEGSYRPTNVQKEYARAAVDAGADIVFGHHTHVLQPVESYNGGVICYSLGNFSFGGNRNPQDKDTAVVQQTVVRETDGTVHLGETKLIPFRLSSVTQRNDFRPIPYEAGTDAYERAMSKLNGTFTGPDITRPPAVETPEETPDTETPGETPDTETPEVPGETPDTETPETPGVPDNAVPDSGHGQSDV